MTAPEGRTPGPDDTAAFQRFYGAGPAETPRQRGVLYRLFVGWWRERT